MFYLRLYYFCEIIVSQIQMPNVKKWFSLCTDTKNFFWGFENPNNILNFDYNKTFSVHYKITKKYVKLAL